MRLILIILSLLPAIAISQVAKLGEPLKEAYLAGANNPSLFIATGEYGDGYSYICDMGQAIPDKDRKDWYINNPIRGLRLEMRARLLCKSPEGLDSCGFIVITKGEEVFTTFHPQGKYVHNMWEGAIFTGWNNGDTNVYFSGGHDGYDGLGGFDILTGKGFLYRTNNSEPEYFLSNCQRIKKENLPIYKWGSLM